MSVRTVFAATILSAVMVHGSVAWADQTHQQEPTDEQHQTGQADEPGAEAIDGPWGPGTTDLMLSMTVGGFLTGYLTAQPGLEVGTVELGEGTTLGLGAEAGMGWCALCPLFALTPGIDRFRSTYVSPRGRMTLHFNQIADGLGIENLDTYAGIVAGPAFYSINLDFADGASAESTIATVIVGPVAGARLTFSGTDGFFAYGEGRYHTEFGRQSVSMEIEGDEDEQVVMERAGDVGRQGLDTFFGVGYRF